MKILKKYLEDHELSAAELARLCEVHESHISRVLAGKRRPSGELYGKLHKVTGLPIEKMIDQAGYEERA